MHVVLAGGGTAGHIEPALALADALRRNDPTIGITALGTERGLETRLVPERGYELADHRIPEHRHHVANSTFVRSLEEAAYLVEQGYAIRMGAPGKRASLISPASLRIVRS